MTHPAMLGRGLSAAVLLLLLACLVSGGKHELGDSIEKVFEDRMDLVDLLISSIDTAEATEEKAFGEHTLLPLPVLSASYSLAPHIEHCSHFKGPIHNCLHSIGHTIAERSTVLPEACATASLDFGCLHGFLERFFELRGDYFAREDVTDYEKSLRMQEVCQSLPSAYVGDCYHAASHAVYASAVSVPAVFEICKYLPKEAAIVCASGGYMFRPPLVKTPSEVLAKCASSPFPSECMNYGYVRVHQPRSCKAAGFLLQECERIRGLDLEPAYYLSCLSAFGYSAHFPQDCTQSRQLGRAAYATLKRTLRDTTAASVILFGARRQVVRTDVESDTVLALCWPVQALGGIELMHKCEEIMLLPQHCVDCEINSLLIPADREGVVYGVPPP